MYQFLKRKKIHIFDMLHNSEVNYQECQTNPPHYRSKTLVCSHSLPCWTPVNHHHHHHHHHQIQIQKAMHANRTACTYQRMFINCIIWFFIASICTCIVNYLEEGGGGGGVMLSIGIPVFHCLQVSPIIPGSFLFPQTKHLPIFQSACITNSK